MAAAGRGARDAPWPLRAAPPAARGARRAPAPHARRPGARQRTRQHRNHKGASFHVALLRDDQDTGARSDEQEPKDNGEVDTDDQAQAAAQAAKRATTKSGTVTAKKGKKTKKKRTVKYLREQDRLAIVQRIERGEKQTQLAREFGVSRAAVCYLNKHRDDILRRSAHLQRREGDGDGRPMSRSSLPSHFDDVSHPPATTTTNENTTGTTTSRWPDTPDDSLLAVMEVRTRPMAVHMTILRSKSHGGSAFRRAADRAFR